MRRTIVLLFLLGFSFSSDLFGWGAAGHRKINRAAIELLPGQLKGFYIKNQKKIVEQSITPDLWKGDDPAERARHFIDLDYYGDYPFAFFPASYEAARKKYGKEKMEKWGLLPWRIEEFFNELAAAFRKRDQKKIVEVSAWLGHYVGDGHVPLHATKNYDGQFTGNNGIHHRFENEMIKLYYDRFALRGTSAAIVVADALEFAFDFVKQSYGDVDIILIADRQAKGHGSAGSPKYFDALFRQVSALAKTRMEKASWALASLWLTAWTRAGKPIF